jgi:hypothetical protein
VHLDDDLRYTATELKLLYIGKFRYSFSPEVQRALFLLLEKTGQHLFKRIGFCEADDDVSNEHFNVKEGFQDSRSRKMGDPKAGAKWTREELRIV